MENERADRRNIFTRTRQVTSNRVVVWLWLIAARGPFLTSRVRLAAKRVGGINSHTGGINGISLGK
jgi:hypothetical protein